MFSGVNLHANCLGHDPFLPQRNSSWATAVHPQQTFFPKPQLPATGHNQRNGKSSSFPGDRFVIRKQLPSLHTVELFVKILPAGGSEEGGETAVTRASVAPIQLLKIHLPFKQVMPFRTQQLQFIPLQVEGTKPRKSLWESNMATRMSMQRDLLQAFYILPLYGALSAKRLVLILPHREDLLSVTWHSGTLGSYSLTRWGGRSCLLGGVVLHSSLIWLPSEFYI